mgnify:CR=1 FL=1
MKETNLDRLLLHAKRLLVALLGGRAVLLRLELHIRFACRVRFLSAAKQKQKHAG